MTDAQQSVFDKLVLVAGASGFVGSHTARELVRQGRNVKVLLRKSSNKQAVENVPMQIV